MAVDFTNDIKYAERQLSNYIRKGQIVPRHALDHYNNLVEASLNSTTLESGGSAGGVGFPSGSLDTTFTSVGTADGVILATNTSRTYVLIQNLGDNSIFINFNATAALNGGLLLLPSASWISQIPQFVQAEIHGIADTAPSDIAVYSIA